MKNEDEGIRAVRDVRDKISAEFHHDPEKLIEHYMEQQKRHRDRLLQPVVTQQAAAATDAARRG
jgi:hypothetical protein